ncbi:hypothetical protein C8F01DRAFT_987460 [Mycena amicta]|nr:hypothetical protein C8F01DRAFT_987460 [Mycena amicta]
MRLVLGRCPWYVDVKPATPFVTLFDVLSALHTQLATPIEAKDYFTKALTKAERARITKAFSERCDKEIARGVRRVDFLTGECFFVGLVRKGGVWEARCVREIAQ